MVDELAGVWKTAGGLLDVVGVSNSDSDESDEVACTARREMRQEALVRTVISTTVMSGREAANN
eukprot:3011384-Pyramimonas_sp.AAC.1